MEIKQTSKVSYVVKASPDEIIDTIVGTQRNKKLILTSFRGDGVVFLSNDKQNWIKTPFQQNMTFKSESFPHRYLKISGNEDKTIYFLKK